MFVLSTEESKERAEEVGSEHVNSSTAVTIGNCPLARPGRTDAPGGRAAKRRKAQEWEDDQDDVEELLGGLGIGSRE